MNLFPNKPGEKLNLRWYVILLLYQKHWLINTQNCKTTMKYVFIPSKPLNVIPPQKLLWLGLPKTLGMENYTSQCRIFRTLQLSKMKNISPVQNKITIEHCPHTTSERWQKKKKKVVIEPKVEIDWSYYEQAHDLTWFIEPTLDQEKEPCQLQHDENFRKSWMKPYMIYQHMIII